MKFSTKTTYGLRAMIQLGKAWEVKEKISLPKIAQTEKISQAYLERIFAKLKRGGLVDSIKGSGGGYSLSKSPNKITVYDIIKEIEGEISPFKCISEDGKINCSAKCRCNVTLVLSKVQKSVIDTLKKIRLKDLL